MNGAGGAERAAPTTVTAPLARGMAPENGVSARVACWTPRCSPRHQINSPSHSVTTTAATIELRVMLPRAMQKYEPPPARAPRTFSPRIPCIRGSMPRRRQEVLRDSCPKGRGGALCERPGHATHAKQLVGKRSAAQVQRRRTRTQVDGGNPWVQFAAQVRGANAHASPPWQIRGTIPRAQPPTAIRRRNSPKRNRSASGGRGAIAKCKSAAQVGGTIRPMQSARASRRLLAHRQSAAQAGGSQSARRAQLHVERSPRPNANEALRAATSGAVRAARVNHRAESVRETRSRR